MPTIKIHYTDNIKISDKLDDFCRDLHSTLVEVINTDIHTCRTLIYPCKNYLIGNDLSNFDAFIQIEANILPGRSSVLRKKLGQILLNDLKSLCNDSDVSIDYRVIVNETNTEFYFGLE
ncbi:5-carboxymethyl-2-hydroxymuconate Delta-isomerase [Francisella sciaenopsi]|uniref:5-carboxymethyl-2-hydroxymuconate isomerase n=1 Tax=Francisella sciaenopsi TaxID=3055034 RepID=A0ABQ6PGY2_9GAMM